MSRSETEPDQGLDDLVAQRRGTGRDRRRSGRTEGRDLVAQFDDHALGTALADPRYPRQRRGVAVGQGRTQGVGFEHGQGGHGEPGADPADRLQQAEQLARLRVDEAVQRHRVLADDHRGGESGLLSAPEPGEGRGCGVDPIADPSRLDHHMVEGYVEYLAVYRGDHRLPAFRAADCSRSRSS